MKLAVASNSIRNTVEVMMQKASLAGYLDAMLSNEDVSRAKPDPEIYLKSMTLLGLAPYETLVVEDNENGIRAARASGAHVLVVGSVDEVNLQAIQQRIEECNAQGDVAA